MRKMTGFEYKQFMAADWDALTGTTGCYMDGQEITVNGVSEPEDIGTIKDSDVVVIHYGSVGADEGIDMSLKTLYGKWKKSQTHDTLVVQAPKAQVGELAKFLTYLGGKVCR